MSVSNLPLTRQLSIAFFCFAVVLFTAPHQATAVSDKLKARSMVLKAKQQLNAGQYHDCSVQALNAKIKLKGTNSDIEYLLTVCQFQTGNYLLAQESLEKYFEITPEEKADPKQYNLMVKLIAEIEVGIKGGTPGDVIGGAPSKAGGIKKAAAKRQNQLPDGKWISLKEAQSNGIPVPFKPKNTFRAGKKVIFERSKNGYFTETSPGLLITNNVRVQANEFERITVEHLSISTDGSKYKYRGKVEDGSGSILFDKTVETSTKLLNFFNFPVRLLKPGVSWTSKERPLYPFATAVPIKYTVDSIENVGGFDCVKVSGYGKQHSDISSDDTWTEVKEQFCYDYNNGSYINRRREIKAFVKGNDYMNIVEENKRSSLTFSSVKNTEIAAPPKETGPKIVARDDVYIAYENGVVKDTSTGLEWMSGPEADFNGVRAKAWVAGLHVNGGGWRMPTAKELRTLFRKGKGKYNMTSLLERSSHNLWSGDTKGGRSLAWFSFDSGEWYWSDEYYSLARVGRVLAVRPARNN